MSKLHTNSTLYIFRPHQKKDMTFKLVESSLDHLLFLFTKNCKNKEKIEICLRKYAQFVIINPFEGERYI